MPSKDVNPISDAIRIVVDEYRTLVKQHPSKPAAPVRAAGREDLSSVMKRFGIRSNRGWQ